MPKYYGCPCEACGQPLTVRDDIVVCPECGAPYHRACYTKMGRCVHSAQHAAGFEWKFPYEASQLRVCPSCGEQTLADEPNCRCCGAALPPPGTPDPAQSGSASGSAAGSDPNGPFDYANFYRQFQQNGGPSEDPMRQIYQAGFGPDQTMDGIPCADWMAYIGPSGPVYMSEYCQMQLQKRKISVSLSATLFGPFYFFYRKAWKPAFAFLAAELVLNLPTLIFLLQASESAFAPGLSDTALSILSRVASVLGFVLMVVRGMYGKWLYRKAAGERIRRIREEFPDAAQRRAVLAAQGGVSIAAVVGAFLGLMVLGGVFSLFLGPNLEAVASLLYL